LLLPETERMVERTLLLPNGTSIDVNQIATICGILREAISRNTEVRAQLMERSAQMMSVPRAV
jgi:hypothetical protein